MCVLWHTGCKSLLYSKDYFVYLQHWTLALLSENLGLQQLWLVLFLSLCVIVFHCFMGEYPLWGPFRKSLGSLHMNLCRIYPMCVFFSLLIQQCILAVSLKYILAFKYYYVLSSINLSRKATKLRLAGNRASVITVIL